jgi:hypothetical protein
MQSRDALKEAVKKERAASDTPPERTARIKIPLAVSTDELSVNGTVTVAGLPGEEVGFDERKGTSLNKDEGWGN